MARLIFPQDRIAYVYTEPGDPILMPGPVPITVYLDEGLTTLADITTLGGSTVVGSVLYVGADGLIPEFYGPADGRSTLWGCTPHGQPYQLDAQPTPRIDEIEADPDSGTHYTHTQGPAAAVWTVSHGLGYRPGGVRAYDPDQVEVIGFLVGYPDDNTLTLTFSNALSGTAYLS